MNIFKKGISPAIALTLLLVTAVLSAVYFQTWFQTFQSNLVIDVEKDSSIKNFNLGIEGLIGEDLYINAGDGLNITQIRIDGEECLFNGSIVGVRGINVSDCLNNLTTNTPNIVLVTTNGVISETVFIRDDFFLENSLNNSTNTSINTSTSLLNVSLNKLSIPEPILSANGTNADTFYYLISLGDWQPYTFVYDNQVYFAIPSKYSDSSFGGWHLTFANWSIGSSLASWVDGNPNATGIKETLNKFQNDINGFDLNSFFIARLTDDGGEIKGMVRKWFRNTEYTFLPTSTYYLTGFSAQNFSSISPSSVLVPTNATTGDGGFVSRIFINNDGTWQGDTRPGLDVEKFGSDFYIYLTTRNSPTNNQSYISIMTTNDFINFTLPTNFTLEGYRNPEVFEYQGDIYMVAFSTSVQKWQLIPGSSPTSFNASQAVTLEIGSVNVAGGGWDSSTTFTDLPNGEPRLAGVEVLDNRIWVFYLAGGDDPAHFNAVAEFGSVPYNGPRGIGLFELFIN